MKVLGGVCALLLCVGLAACGSGAPGNPAAVSHRGSGESSLSPAEKSRLQTEELSKRIREAICQKDSVAEASVVIAEAEDAGKSVDIAIVLEPGQTLTEEESDNIVRFAEQCFDPSLPVQVSLTTAQS